MANWCSTNLSFTHSDKKVVQEFQERCKTLTEGDDAKMSLIDFNNFLPCPYETPELQRDWKWDNWGTRTNAVATEILYPKANQSIEESEEGYTYTLRFDTAWSPPSKVFDKISRLYPEAEIEVWCSEEADLWTSFEQIIKNGKTIHYKLEK
jgi:hypothetical protein